LARKPADQSVSREEIIWAAADVLRHNGYEATTMKDIAAEVNLTAASLYHHFRNKDELLLAVLEAGLDYVIDKIEPIVHSNKPSDHKLRAMIGTEIVALTGNTAVGAAMVYEIHALMNIKPPAENASPDDHDAHQEFIERRDAFFARRDYFEDLFRCVMREGIESGKFRQVDVGIFSKILLGANNWVGVWYKEAGRLNGQQIADMISDTLLNGVIQKH
jgi:TetR/AcrR family transcriptional regulator, cholesterol catabolism regulator